jgi:hypothetical protein
MFMDELHTHVGTLLVPNDSKLQKLSSNVCETSVRAYC